MNDLFKGKGWCLLPGQWKCFGCWFSVLTLSDRLWGCADNSCPTSQSLSVQPVCGELKICSFTLFLENDKCYKAVLIKHRKHYKSVTEPACFVFLNDILLFLNRDCVFRRLSIKLLYCTCWICRIMMKLKPFSLDFTLWYLWQDELLALELFALGCTSQEWQNQSLGCWYRAVSCVLPWGWMMHRSMTSLCQEGGIACCCYNERKVQMFCFRGFWLG